jgi:hypothetical protein
MKVSKAAKSYEIMSENPKMDTSGMAGKPMPMDMYTYEMKMPTMNLREMMEMKAKKDSKRKVD